MISEAMKPLVFALADAIETDLTSGARGANSFAGSRKAVLELFEGYSPTIISGLENSLYDPGNDVVAADQHIFGNVGAITVVDGRMDTITCFVYDRSKRLDAPSFGNFWSRKDLYEWLEPCVQAVYHRPVYANDWKKLEKGKVRLREYNSARNQGASAKTAYMAMWEDRND